MGVDNLKVAAAHDSIKVSSEICSTREAKIKEKASRDSRRSGISSLTCILCKIHGIVSRLDMRLCAFSRK